MQKFQNYNVIIRTVFFIGLATLGMSVPHVYAASCSGATGGQVSHVAPGHTIKATGGQGGINGQPGQDGVCIVDGVTIHGEYHGPAGDCIPGKAGSCSSNGGGSTSTTPPTVRGVCGLVNKGAMQNLLARKLRDELSSQGVKQGRVNIKLSSSKDTSSHPIPLSELFKNTHITLVNGAAPSAIFESSASPDLQNCYTNYQVTAKYGGTVQAPSVGAKGTGTKFSGESSGTITVNGQIAPTTKLLK